MAKLWVTTDHDKIIDILYSEDLEDLPPALVGTLIHDHLRNATEEPVLTAHAPLKRPAKKASAVPAKAPSKRAKARA